MEDDHAKLEGFHKWRPVYNLAAKGAEGKAEAAAWRYYGGADDIDRQHATPSLWQRLLARVKTEDSSASLEPVTPPRRGLARLFQPGG